MIKFKNKIFIITLVMLILLSISTISATQEDATATNETGDESTLKNDALQSTGDNEDVLSDIGRYSELEGAFQTNDKFTFEKDYEAHNGDGQINIKRSIEIDGNGHYIDSKGIVGIFQTDNSDTQNIDVVIKNLIFKNAKRENGGAIFAMSST